MISIVNETLGSCREIPAPIIGSSSNSVVAAITLRPPDISIMKELVIRKVAPASPATPGSIYSRALYSSPVNPPQPLNE